MSFGLCAKIGLRVSDIRHNFAKMFWNEVNVKIQPNVVSVMRGFAIIFSSEGASQRRSNAFRRLYAEADQPDDLLRLLIHVRRA